MNCPACGHENPEGARFCNECAGPLPLWCVKCGTSNPAGSKFCNECASPLGSGGTTNTRSSRQARPEISFGSELIASSAISDGERKTVTALFADIKGSTELMAELDPEEARRVIDPALELMIEAVRRYDGYIVQSVGDGIFALFGAPVAREDHPQRALLAALRLQETLHNYSAKLVADGGTPLEARVGVNTGEVVVRTLRTTEGHAEYSPIGHTANLASRMQAIATTGSIAITEHTRRLIEGYFQLKSCGPTRVKGLAEPINVYEVTGLGPLRTRLQRAASRGFSKFVGREREMDTIRHAADLAKQGHGQVVAVIAEPGVGKSRLFYEFKASSQSGWLVQEAASVSHGKATAYLPVIDLLHGYFAIEPNDDIRRRREKVGGKALMLERSLEDTLPFLFALLGLSDTEDQTAQMGPQIRRRLMHEAVKRILFKESLDQPLMLIFEDLHWIDGETQSLLNLLIDSLATARILLLVNYRPEFQHQWGSRTYYTQLRLDPLGRENAEVMLSSLLGNEPELAPLKRLIIERTEGNPFFIEETFQTLLEDGALVRNGQVKLARPLAQLKIPATVQAILAARIDRLPPTAKELLQVLAVLGNELPLKLITEVTGKNEEQIDPLLSDLQGGEFIYEQASAAGRAFVFKHSLTEEVAYHSVLVERRRAIHEQAGAAIETFHAAQLEDWYADLAHHYLRTSNGPKAVRYALLAAEQAMNRGAYPEAASVIQAGLKLLEKLAENDELRRGELRLRSIQSVLERASHGSSPIEIDRVIRRMCELGEQIGEQEELLRALLALSTLHFTRGEIARGLEVAERCTHLAESVQDTRLRADAHWRAGILAQHAGRLRQGLRQMEYALRNSSQANLTLSTLGFSYRIILPTGMAQTQQLLGYSDRSLKLAEEGLRYARESKHWYGLGGLLSIIKVSFHCNRREPEIVRLHTGEAIVLSEQHGFSEWLQQARFFHGWSLSELGQPEAGIAEMETATAEFQHWGGIPLCQFSRALLANAYAAIGRTDDALALLDDALLRIERTGEKLGQAEMLRLKGAIHLHRKAATRKSEECFRGALEVARMQEAKWWELRASVSLARLLRDTNRRDEARTMLAEIYNWFTEGFDLPDLKEAKALLDDLST